MPSSACYADHRELHSFPTRRSSDLMMSDTEGKEVILSILGSGEFFGEMGLIDDSPRSASVVAIEACELLCVNKRDFNRCLAENFDMRSEEHTSELQSLTNLVCRLLLATPTTVSYTLSLHDALPIS